MEIILQTFSNLIVLKQKINVVKDTTVPYTDVLTKPSLLISPQILQSSTISQQTVNTILERHSAPYFREKKLDHFKADKYFALCNFL
jgi:hypothetical protein